MGANSPSPRARALSAALRGARIASNIGVRELGRLMSISPSQISHWEHGDRVPNVETVATIVGALRISAEERERILELARQASEPHWLSVGVNGIPQQLAAVVECERAAHRIVAWATMAIPGLLQTLDYARAIKRAADLPEPDIELRLMVNASRRDVITRRDDPVQFTALISEVAFHQRIGSPEIMLDQFRLLAEIAGHENVTIQIVSQDVGWHPGWAGPFMFFEFPTTSPVVYFEHHSSGAFVSENHDIEEYRKAVTRMRTIAMDSAASAVFMAEVIKRMESGL